MPELRKNPKQLPERPTAGCRWQRPRRALSPNLISQQHQLPACDLSQTADAESNQSQRPRNKFFLPQQKTAEPIDILGFSDWFLHGKLPRQRGEIAVADFDLHRFRRDSAVFEPGRNVRCLFAQALAQRASIVCIAQKRFLAADAFDLIAQLQSAVVVAKGELFQLWPE